jgi:hypothetical protein
MPFVPAVVQPALLSDRPLWFVVEGSGIAVRAEGNAVALPTDAELALWGLDQPALALPALADGRLRRRSRER